MKRDSLAGSLSLLLLASATACSTTATITNKNATRAEVRIARSTSTELVVATREGERVIARDQITDIDQPGRWSGARWRDRASDC